jgi:hypothetical protein
MDGDAAEGSGVARTRVFFALDLAVNFLLPWLTYRVARPHVDEAHAIMISAVPPIAWGLVTFARKRKVDAFSILSLGGIAFSLGVFALGGSPKVLLVRESFVSGAIGVVFLGSALIGRPLMLEVIRAMAKSMPPGEAGAKMRHELEVYGDAPPFRRLMTTMTIAFGTLGIAEMAARIALALSLPTERFLLIAPIARWAIAGVVMGWVFFFVVPAFRREMARD